MNFPTMTLPPPPDDLMIRIGVSPALSADARVAVYDDVGAGIYRNIRDAVTHASGQTVLDFGCGTGRVLRWFATEPDINLVGCDIHDASVAWMQASFPPAVRLYVNGDAPPLPEENDTFDLIYCGSVFSHLTDWAPWLLELRRILKPGGALVASLHGRGFWEEGVHGKRGVPWDEDHTGMLVEHYGSTFDDSWGPAVYVSEWWIREHWGRALEIERFEPTGFGLPDNPSSGQGWLVARKPEHASPLTAPELEAPGTDARETTAALRGRQLAYEEIGQLANEAKHLRSEWGRLNTLLSEPPGENQVLEAQALEAQIAELHGRLSVFENSRSWKLTKPLRSAMRHVASSRLSRRG
jgi:SAM-dependent methyltransferase